MTYPSASPLIHPESLGETLDSINLALFDHRALSAADRAGAAAWLADRQGLPGAYAGMFAPTEQDYAFGTLTFTGEPVLSAAGTGHVLGEEACAALFRLGVDTPETRAALKQARQGIFKRIEQSEAQGQMSGVYCCGTCSVALWRHLSTSGEENDARRLESGLAELRRSRDGEGRWRRFPFYYSLLALTGIDHPSVIAEIQYALTVIERAQRRLEKLAQRRGLSEHDRRRKVVLERILEKS
ncbi:MAG TPA: hypothetical protein VF806_06765 [Anaerolineaceae bacterium]